MPSMFCFPRVVADEPDVQPSDLWTNDSLSVSYKGVGQDDDCADVIAGYVRPGFLRAFDTIEQVTSSVGAKPLLMSRDGRRASCILT